MFVEIFLLTGGEEDIVNGGLSGARNIDRYGGIGMGLTDDIDSTGVITRSNLPSGIDLISRGLTIDCFIGAFAGVIYCGSSRQVLLGGI